MHKSPNYINFGLDKFQILRVAQGEGLMIVLKFISVFGAFFNHLFHVFICSELVLKLRRLKQVKLFFWFFHFFTPRFCAFYTTLAKTSFIDLQNNLILSQEKEKLKRFLKNRVPKNRKIPPFSQIKNSFKDANFVKKSKEIKKIKRKREKG